MEEVANLSIAVAHPDWCNMWHENNFLFPLFNNSTEPTRVCNLGVDSRELGLVTYSINIMTKIEIESQILKAKINNNGQLVIKSDVKEK